MNLASDLQNSEIKFKHKLSYINKTQRAHDIKIIKWHPAIDIIATNVL
jgi:hypothetical protein